MNVTAKAYTYRGGRCRYCKRKMTWKLCRDLSVSTWNQRWDQLCDEHFGLALRNLGLVSLTIEHTAVVTASVRP